VSNYHATADFGDTVTATSLRPLLGALRALNAAVGAIGAALRAAIVRRGTQRRLAKLSDHMLRDFGFERDWDGSIRSLRDAD
jgi:hypothetical protein